MAQDPHDEAHAADAAPPDSEPLANLGTEDAADAAPPASPHADDSEAAELQEFKHSNRKRLYMFAGLLVAIVLSFVVGHWHDAWRAIVLDVRQDQMFLGYEKKPPEWVDGRITEPGNIVMKQAWSWSSEPTTVEVNDDALVALYQRYTKTYTGTLVEIRPPSRPGTFPMGVIHTDSGGREYVTLVDTVLLGAELNRRVEKTKGTWDPKLLPKDNAAVQFVAPVLPTDPKAPPGPDAGKTPPAPPVPDAGKTPPAPPPTPKP